jgi:cytosine permease
VSDAPEQDSPSDIAWPPTLRAEIDSTPAPRRPWYLTIGPAYLTIFVWAPFFDPLWRHDLAGAGLARLAGSAVLAALLCFGLFYYPAAMWGYRTGRRLGVVAASTFGTTGSDWLTGIVLAAAEIVWYAVAIDYAVQSTLLGLVTCGLLPPGVLMNWQVGGTVVRGPVVLCTAVFWIFITGMASLLRLTSVIAALMKVYSPVALTLLTITAIWVLPGVSAFQSGEPFAGKAVQPYPPHLSTIPIFTGFFSMVGLMSVEWGAAAARRRDVVVGGLLGIVLAGCWTAVMSLLVVAGAVGRLHAAHPVEAATADTPVLSFRWAVANGIGGAPAAVVLILFGLAALAPACYSSFLFMRKLFARWPRVRRVDWGWIGCTLAFLLIATSWPGRLEAVDHMMGLVFAPAAGAMAGDYVAQRGRWAGVRRGHHPPGLIAWAVGLASRLILDLLGQRGLLPVPSLLASPISGFLAAALAYLIMAGLGLARPAVPIETFPTGSGEVAAEVGQLGDAPAASSGQTA